MLANTDAMATIAVRNIAAAREFYGNVLGLQGNPVGGAAEGEVLSYLSGSSRIMVYRPEFAGSNKATSATWTVGDEIEEIVAALKEKKGRDIRALPDAGATAAWRYPCRQPDESRLVQGPGREYSQYRRQLTRIVAALINVPRLETIAKQAPTLSLISDTGMPDKRHDELQLRVAAKWVGYAAS